MSNPDWDGQDRRDCGGCTYTSLILKTIDGMVSDFSKYYETVERSVVTQSDRLTAFMAMEERNNINQTNNIENLSKKISVVESNHREDIKELYNILRELQKEVKESNEILRKEINDNTAAVSNAKFGWKLLVSIGSIMAFVIGLGTWMLDYLGNHVK